MMLGTGVGVGATLWGRRKVRARMARYRPAQVTAQATRAVRRFGAELRAAADAGRQAMRQREAELRLAHRAPSDPYPASETSPARR